MRRILECVPNFSEGRRKEVVDSLAAALTGPSGVALLDSEMDAAHNRCVITIAGDPQSVARGVVEAVGRAVELIDLRQHAGEHPRMGAADVIPLVPISGITIEEAIELSVQVAEEISRRYRIPVYLYELSARVAARQDLAYIRKGEFEGIRDEIRTNPEHKPDFGPSEVHPSAGVTAVGVRPALIAYNCYLNTPDLKVAQAIARALRFSTGGLRYVKALGFEIKQRNQVQVSMNLTNFEGTPIFRAFEMVKREAERFGVQVASSEIVGLIPQKALDACSDYYLRLEGFTASQILENRLAEALPQETSRDEFVESVASPQPVPGGGSVAAFTASLAAALGEMVSGLTEGKKKFEGVDARVRELHDRLSEARAVLRGLVQEDSAAFEDVMRAIKLPKGTDQEKSARLAAMENATRHATDVPLRTARTAAEVLALLEELAGIGNPNARSDAATGAQLAGAALKGAQYNVLINIPGLKDAAFADACRKEMADLACKAQGSLQRIDVVMTETRLPT
jgi:glutamate formiminotransferase/formiminotetrahydrofolate cyclodeaminase